MATIAPRQHQSVRHPTVAPPPPPPHLPSSSAAVLEIGSPMAVTINGVNVTNHSNAKMPQIDASSSSVVRPPKGFLVPAKMAIAHEDIPDSMGHVSLTSKPPPPLPMSPPPDDDEDQYTEA